MISLRGNKKKDEGKCKERVDKKKGAGNE